MKSVSNKTFPFPVLRANSQDYLGEDGERGFSLTVVEEQVQGRSDPYFILQFELTQPDLLELIESGKATYAVLVESRKTMYHQLWKTKDNNLDFKCGPGVLGGKVIFHPYVIATDDFSEFKSDRFNERWKDLTVFPRKDHVLAVGVRQQTNVGQEKFGSFGSCWKVVPNENKKPGEIDFNIETDDIQIIVSESDANWIIRETKRKKSKPMIYQAIILPILLEVLHIMATQGGDYDGKPWYEVIALRLSKLGYPDLKPDMDFFKIAQELVEYPLKHLAKGER